jgi:hypothetical protein
VGQMVDACPSLEALQLRGEAIIEKPPSALSRLQHLTSLVLFARCTQVCSCVAGALLRCVHWFSAAPWCQHMFLVTACVSVA